MPKQSIGSETQGNQYLDELVNRNLRIKYVWRRDYELLFITQNQF